MPLGVPLVFPSGKYMWLSKLDACHQKCETIYAGVLSNKKGGNAYEVILGDVMKTESFEEVLH